MAQINFLEKIKTHILQSTRVFFFRKSCGLWYNVENHFEAGQARDDNMAHPHCLLDNSGYKHTLTICYNYRFSTAKMFARTRLNVTLYVHCVSC